MQKTNWLADLIYSAGNFQSGVGLLCDNGGAITGIATPEDDSAIKLHDRAVLPGLINAHSHAFQRVIRGRTEYRSTDEKDSFWTWREMMYSAAARLTPEDVYDASRMAFLEMALSGITCVGEFHYLHNAPDGRPYEDANLLAKQVVRAANDVGLRIALLRVAYARSGHETEINPRQARFIESDPEVYLKNLERLITDLDSGDDERGQAPSAWVGVAPHSVRAVPLPYLREVVNSANERQLPVHMHVAEQPAEVSACIQEYGRSPVALLETEGLLSERFTGVHVIHVTPKAIGMLARSGAMVCACPTTERNLGDGIIPVDSFFNENVRVALGTDSHVEIDLLEDARELEYHLRLQKLERAVLDKSATRNEGETRDTNSDGTETEAKHSGLAARLFDCATVNGAASLGAPGGALNPGRPADFFTVDLNDPSIAGASENDLLPSIVFSISRTAIKDVVVGGKRIVEDGRHAQQEEIVLKFKALQKRLWGLGRSGGKPSFPT
ncbi:MAG: formimidoylglutamate deiminase [Acidobacteriota bacterium]|nr:formimidoylglutamate deiminase [Acidobacteriota bacterium]